MIELIYEITSHLMNKMSTTNQIILSSLIFRFTLKGIIEKPLCFHEGPATYVIQLKEDHYVMTFPLSKCNISHPLSLEDHNTEKIRLHITFFWNSEGDSPLIKRHPSTDSSSESSERSNSYGDLSSSEISVEPSNEFIWRLRCVPTESTKMLTRFTTPDCVNVYTKESDKFLGPFDRYCLVKDLRLNSETNTFSLLMDSDVLGELILSSRCKYNITLKEDIP